MIPLQVLTNYKEHHKDQLLRVVREATDLGVPYVQFCWEGTDRETCSLAEQIKQIVSNTDTKLIVNNRIDIALMVEADGVHLGQADMPVDIARKVIPSSMMLGLTVSTEEHINQARGKVDFYGIGPVFDSKTNPGSTLGLHKLNQLCKLADKPVVAIGGINLSNIESVFKAGASGVAVIGSVYDSINRVQTIKELVTLSNMLSDRYQSYHETHQ